MLRLLVFLSFFSLLFGAVADDTLTEIKEPSAFETFFISAQDSIASLIIWMVDKIGLCKPVTALPSGIIELSILAIIASFLIHLALYLVSKILNQENAYVVFSVELTNVFSNIVLILLVLAIINVMIGYNIFEEAKQYLIKILVKNGIFQMYLMGLNQMVIYFSNIRIPLTFGTEQWFAASANLDQLMKLTLSLLGILLNTSALITIQYAFKLFLICLSANYFMTLLFPVGIFLRSFYLTRSGGNVILGIAIAFAILYPFILFLMGKLYYVVFDTWFTYIEKALRKMVVTLVYYLIGYMIRLAELGILSGVMSFLSSITGPLAPLLNSMPAISNAINTIIRGGVTISLLMTFANALISLLFGYGMFLVMFGLVLGPLTIFLTLLLAGEVSEKLGTRINLAAFTRLI